MSKIKVGDICVWSGNNPAIVRLNRYVSSSGCYYANEDNNSLSEIYLRIATQKEINALGERDVLELDEPTLKKIQEEFPRADKSILFKLIEKLISAGFRGSSQEVVDNHIENYKNEVNGD